MAIDTYDPDKLSVVFGGLPIRGFCADSALIIEREDQLYNSEHDLHGNISRTKVNRNTAKITLNLTRGSHSNRILSAFVEADRLNNSGVFPIMIKQDGNTQFACTDAYITQYPKIEHGKDEKSKEWVIQASGVTQFVGN